LVKDQKRNGGEQYCCGIDIISDGMLGASENIGGEKHLDDDKQI